MNIKCLTQRLLSASAATALAVMMLLPVTTVFAANTQFITDIKLEAGADAVEKLEADGYSVMLTGLNMIYDASKQVYLGYKMNDGKPITNIIISLGGDSLKDNNGISYDRASDVDVDEGIGGTTGYLYFTRDEKAGSPLVGLDVLRSKEEEIYPITNDGAEIVRTEKGIPADLESASDSAVVYLAQIRDGIVRPYIGEIGVVTDKDKWNAVYTACERGYNYYVEGDIDTSKETYTILVYKRTADVKNAVTSITAVSRESVDSMEANAGGLTGAAINISGVEYVRVSSTPIDAEQPYYLYQTKNTSAGNPVSMLYAEKQESEQNSIFGTWIDGYFASQGKTSSYMFCANEDIYSTLRADLTVMTKLPVKYLTKSSSVQPAEPEATSQTVVEVTTAAAPETEQISEIEESSVSETEATSEDLSTPEAEIEANPEGLSVSETETEVISEEPAQETTTETTAAQISETNEETMAETQEANNTVNIVMLTPRDGLPESAAQIMGLTDNSAEAPVIERTERSDRKNKFGASVFGKHGGAAIILGGIAIVGVGVATVIIRKKKSDKAR